MESSAQGGSRAVEQTATGSPGTNGHAFADDLSDLPADFGRAKTKAGDDDDPARKAFDKRPSWADEDDPKTEQEAEKRLKRQAAKRYAVTALDELTDTWARSLRSRIERADALRDPLKYPPHVMFAGDWAVKSGVTDAQLGTLPELSTDEIAALRVEASATQEATRMQVRERGRQIAAAAEVAGYANITTRVDLATYTPPDDPWIVDGLIPLGKSMGLFSERKAGKTTTVVDLVGSLLTGGKFLGRLATRLPADADVVLLDSEMGADMMQYEFSTAGVSDPAVLRRINYHDLFGRSAMLDMRNDATRAYWRDQIRPGSFIILDCLYTVLSGLGVDESSSQVADVIEGFKALAVECAAAGLVIVHHLGKTPTRARAGTAR